MDLPDLPAGIYQHWRGHLYQALGYAPDDTFPARIVVVYIGLQLDGAKPGSRMKIRTALTDNASEQAWWDWVHPDGAKCLHQRPSPAVSRRSGKCAGEVLIRPRFLYTGPGWNPKETA